MVVCGEVPTRDSNQNLKNIYIHSLTIEKEKR